jgi:Fe2+ or Zn2+ uptake regulation protein
MTGASQLDTRLTEALRERGNRVTPQRLAINRALHRLGRHATAEEVLRRVSNRVPGVSLPTVYATLELLDELGLARRVTAGEGPALFDPRTDPHHHAVCRRCGRVEDLDAPVRLDPAVRAARGRGFRAAHAEVTVSGLCARCASKS